MLSDACQGRDCLFTSEVVFVLQTKGDQGKENPFFFYFCCWTTTMTIFMCVLSLKKCPVNGGGLAKGRRDVDILPRMEQLPQIGNWLTDQEGKTYYYHCRPPISPNSSPTLKERERESGFPLCISIEAYSHSSCLRTGARSLLLLFCIFAFKDLTRPIQKLLDKAIKAVFV